MAKLLKERARKPVMDDACVYGAETCHDQFFELNMFWQSAPRYRILLTRAEMLSVVAEWMKMEARDATHQEKKLREAKAA